METYACLKDLVYARVSQSDGAERALTLDLYLPRIPIAQPVPLIVWIHGGAWRVGDKTWCSELLPLVEDGYALASVDYRLSQEGIFPTQIRDVRAAVRWLRWHAADWNLDAERFAAGGSSAGGHLAALLGAAFYMKNWDHGDYTECAPREISSAVQAVIDWYGPTDFTCMNAISGEMDHFAPDSPESQLIGGAVCESLERAAAASPMTYAYPTYPAYLLLHGMADRTVLPNQSELLYETLVRRGCRAQIAFIEGAGHGFEGEDYAFALQHTRAFLRRELLTAALPAVAYYACSPETFRPRTRYAVRWLNPYEDYERARAYWNLKPENDLSRVDWLDAHEMGYSYAAALVEDKIVSAAAVWRFSETAWELAAVSTLDETRRQQGYATSVCSFITKYILAMERIPTVSTAVDNVAMQRTAEKVGYRRV